MKIKVGNYWRGIGKIYEIVRVLKIGKEVQFITLVPLDRRSIRWTRIRGEITIIDIETFRECYKPYPKLKGVLYD